MLLQLAGTYALAGKRKEMQDCVEKIKTKHGGTVPEGMATAEMYVTLGESSRAIRALESAYGQRGGSLILLDVDPRLDSLKSDPRFQQLLQLVGLPR